MNVADPRFDLLAFRSGPVPHDLARLFLGVFSSTRRALGYLALRALHCQVSRSGLDGSSHAGAFAELVLSPPFSRSACPRRSLTLLLMIGLLVD